MTFDLTVRELARFLGVSYEEALKRVRGYSVKVAADKWQKANPQSAETRETIICMS